MGYTRDASTGLLAMLMLCAIINMASVSVLVCSISELAFLRGMRAYALHCKRGSVLHAQHAHVCIATPRHSIIIAFIYPTAKLAACKLVGLSWHSRFCDIACACSMLHSTVARRLFHGMCCNNSSTSLCCDILSCAIQTMHTLIRPFRHA